MPNATLSICPTLLIETGSPACATCLTNSKEAVTSAKREICGERMADISISVWWCRDRLKEQPFFHDVRTPERELLHAKIGGAHLFVLRDFASGPLQKHTSLGDDISIVAKSER